MYRDQFGEFVHVYWGFKFTIKIVCTVGNLAMSVLHQICTCSSTKGIYLYERGHPQELAR